MNMTKEIENLILYNRQVRARLNASTIPEGTFYWLLAIHTATERLGHAPCSSELGKEMNLAAVPHITKIEDHGFATIEKIACRTGKKKVFRLTASGIEAMKSIVVGVRS